MPTTPEPPKDREDTKGGDSDLNDEFADGCQRVGPPCKKARYDYEDSARRQNAKKTKKRRERRANKGKGKGHKAMWCDFCKKTNHDTWRCWYAKTYKKSYSGSTSSGWKPPSWEEFLKDKKYWSGYPKKKGRWGIKKPHLKSVSKGAGKIKVCQSTDESPAGAAIPEKPGKKKKEKTEERAERQYKKVTNDPVVKRESPCVKSESEGENSVKKEIDD
jgi:hypothetical protein